MVLLIYYIYFSYYIYGLIIGIKFIFCYFLLIYLILNILLKVNIYKISLVILVINLIKLLDYINALNIIIINDNIEGTYKGFNKLDLLGVNHLLNWYNNFMLKLYNLIFNTKYVKRAEGYNSNENNEFIIENDILAIKDSDYNYFSVWNLYKIFYNYDFYWFYYIFRRKFNNVDNSFSQVNAGFKNISNYFYGINNNSIINILDSELDEIILNLNRVWRDYNYINSKKAVYLLNKHEYYFYGELYLNIEKANMEIGNIKSRIAILNDLNSLLVFRKDQVDKIDKIESLLCLVETNIKQIEYSYFFLYYNIEKELNFINREINRIESKMHGYDIIKVESDLILTKELCEALLYKYFLQRERLYFLDKFKIGYDPVELFDAKSFVSNNINIIYYYINRRFVHYNITQDDFIYLYLKSNAYFKERYIYESYCYEEIYNKKQKDIEIAQWYIYEQIKQQEQEKNLSILYDK